MPDAGDIRGLSLILTARCNLACAYCYQNNKQARRMGWTTLREALDVILGSSRPGREIEFVGGEPLLELDLIRRAVEYVERRISPGRSIRYSILTNGTKLDRPTTEFLARHRFQTQISCDGGPEAMVLRGDWTFAIVDRVLDRIRTENPAFYRDQVSVRMVVAPSTIPYLSASVDYLLGKGVQDLGMGPAEGYEEGWSEELAAELERQLARIYDTCLRLYRETGRVPLTLFRKWNDGHEAGGSRPLCGAGQADSLTVDVDGQVYGCVRLVDSYQKFDSELLRGLGDSLRIGGVQEADLPRRLVAYEAAVQANGLFQRKEENYSGQGPCRDCRFFAECAVCPVTIGLIPGNSDPRRMPDFQCGFQKITLGCRERFPAQPTIVDQMVGRAPFPGRLREFAELAAARRRGGRADGPFRGGSDENPEAPDRKGRHP